MRRRVDLRWRISPEEISRLQQTQLDLLKLAATKLKPGGVLVYSTCSLEPEENSEVVKEFLREHPEFQIGNRTQIAAVCGQCGRGLHCKIVQFVAASRQSAATCLMQMLAALCRDAATIKITSP